MPRALNIKFNEVKAKEEHGGGGAILLRLKPRAYYERSY